MADENKQNTQEAANNAVEKELQNGDPVFTAKSLDGRIVDVGVAANFTAGLKIGPKPQFKHTANKPTDAQMSELAKVCSNTKNSQEAIAAAQKWLDENGFVESEVTLLTEEETQTMAVAGSLGITMPLDYFEEIGQTADAISDQLDIALNNTKGERERASTMIKQTIALGALFEQNLQRFTPEGVAAVTKAVGDVIALSAIAEKAMLAKQQDDKLTELAQNPRASA